MQLVISSISPDASRARDGVALGLRRRAVDVLGADAGLDELIAQMDRVRDVDGEGDGLSALAEFMPVRHDIADQLGAIHAVGELTFVVIAGDGAHALEIRIDRRIGARLDQILLRRSARRPAGIR